MPTDRHLTALLRAFQDDQGLDEGLQLLPTAAALLTSLSNPLNVTLLTSQILTAPAIWTRSNDLRTCHRVLGVFQSATHARLSKATHNSTGGLGVLSGPQWAEAVVQGADKRSLSWTHLLVIGGVLLGLEATTPPTLSKKIKLDLQADLVRAVNLVVVQDQGARVEVPSLGLLSTSLVMSLTFPVLSEAARRQLKHEALLPVILSAVLFSSEGFESGYFLGASDADVVQDSENRFTWSARSMTFLRLKQMTTGLLFGAMGSVSRLVAYLVEDAADPYVVELTMDHLSTFCRTVVLQWRRTKLSEIDPSEEGLYLSQEALNITLPVLWQTLKAIMFSTIVILQAVTARALKDAALSNDRAPPVIAKQILIILHDLAFISYRLGSNAFSAYNFVFLTALDVLSRYADESTALLVAIRPQQLGRISAHPLDRCLDLYFLNASEHLTLVTPQSMSEELLVAAATPYLTSTGNINLVETFEAAHSLMLAILSAPQNAELSRRVIPFYVEALFEAFPQNLSPRQFRFAFKTMIRLSSPASALFSVQSDLASILMELIHERAFGASTSLLPPPLPNPSDDFLSSGQSPALSEQAVLVLALVDALPSLRLEALEEWLPLVAETVRRVEDSRMLDACRQRFWNVLSNGEMDVDRSALCVSWWSTGGGREMITPIDQDLPRSYMSGALS